MISIIIERDIFVNHFFKKLNKKLKKNNINIYAFRGNHDNPEYFSNIELKSKVLNGVTNIHLVDDYDIIQNDTLSTLISILEDSKADLVFCGLESFNKSFNDPNTVLFRRPCP